MRKVRRFLVAFLLFTFMATPFAGFSQEATFVNNEILNNEGIPAGMPGPGGFPSGIPGGGQSVDVTDSVINSIIAAFASNYLGPGFGGGFTVNGVTQLFSGNPAYVRKYGSVKSGVTLNGGDFTWDVGAGLHLFGKIKNEDEVNRNFDFALRDNERFRMDLSYGRLINRQIWHSGEFGDYIVDARNWYKGSAASLCGIAGCFTAAMDPALSANGADPSKGFYLIYHNSLVTGQLVNGVPDYWSAGFGTPIPVSTKANDLAMMKYTPLTESDIRLETEFRPASWLRGILGYQSSGEGGQDEQQILSFLIPITNGITQTQLLPLPAPAGPSGNLTAPGQLPLGPPANGHPKFQWESRQITAVRDPLAYHTTDYTLGTDFSFEPVELLATLTQSDFRNNQIINPFLQDLLNMPWGWNEAATLANGKPTASGLYNSLPNVIAFDAGILPNDYRVEDNHWSTDHLRMQIPLREEAEDSLQFKFNRTVKYSDASFYNVFPSYGDGGPINPLPGFLAGAPITPDPHLFPGPNPDSLPGGVPAGMFQATISPHGNILELPTFDRPQVNLDTFQFYAPLTLGSWRLIPNIDHVAYVSSDGVFGMPEYHYTSGGIELQQFGLHHSLSFDINVETRRNTAMYETRSVNSWTIQNPVMNSNFVAGWLPYLPQIIALYNAGGVCSTGIVAPGGCPGPQGSLGSIQVIIDDHPTHPVGIQSINSTKYTGDVRYSLRLTNALNLMANSRFVHNDNPYYRTDPSDENTWNGHLNWRVSPTVMAALGYTYDNARNSRFLFPENTNSKRGSATLDWQATPQLNFNAGMYRLVQGINMQSPITTTSLTQGIIAQITSWLLASGISSAALLANPGPHTPWAGMYFLPDQNGINWAYKNQNTSYNFGFNYSVDKSVSLFGNWSHTAMTASLVGSQKVQNALELPFGFDGLEPLWSLNTPPNLDVRQNSALLGLHWRRNADTTFSFMAGYDEYQDLNARVSMFNTFALGSTPPNGSGTSTGQVYSTSPASFGSPPAYPTMISPDSGKVLYFNVSWTRRF